MHINLFGQSGLDIREHYHLASTDKKICAQIIEELESKNITNTERAFLGAYQTIWANHAINPISKLATFKKGKKNLELAISKELDNIELRALRISIQQNAPKFLGYYDDLDKDKRFVNLNKSKVKSKVVIDFINKIL